MTDSSDNPYRPPENERHETAVEDAPIAPQSTPPLTSAGRRLTSTVICTGGVLWCLISLAVLIETSMNPTDHSNMKVILLFAAIGAATFVLGMYMRHNKPRHTYLSFLVILLLLVLFPLVAMSTEATPNVLDQSGDLLDWTDG